MDDLPQRSITELLVDSRSGDAEALNQLMPLVYDELRRLAGSYMRHESGGHTLQPTALVHDAYVRLVNVDIAWQDRAHFYSVAARTMRRILVDHARGRERMKRGGGLRVTLTESLNVASQPALDILDLEDALQRLLKTDERKGQILELHFFGGLSYDETADALGISAATVDRELRFAKAWLQHELSSVNDES
jgi:RNA polymerase sigma factor (TIGR02999 family)